MNRTCCKKTGLAVFLFLMAHLVLQAQTGSAYNKRLADSLGADDYGMKMYVLVILKTGPATITDKAKTDSLFSGHLRNIKRLAALGKLTVAGPLQKNEDHYEGLFVLNTKTKDEAKALLDTDPAVQAGLLEPVLYGWYGSAALPLYLPAVEKVSKKTF